MSYFADAHRDWHAVHGWNTQCPLDCYDPHDDEPDTIDAAESVPVETFPQDERPF